MPNECIYDVLLWGPLYQTRQRRRFGNAELWASTNYASEVRVTGHCNTVWKRSATQEASRNEIFAKIENRCIRRKEKHTLELSADLSYHRKCQTRASPLNNREFQDVRRIDWCRRRIQFGAAEKAWKIMWEWILKEWSSQVFRKWIDAYCRSYCTDLARASLSGLQQ